MRYRETPLCFDCEGASLLGVLASPGGAARIGVVIVVGGPQYRAGSHRQFVLLARSLAQAGIPCLRFDYRGMGDSEGAPRSFESIDADIAAAVGALRRETGVSGTVLWGLCDGASAAMMYAARDPGIAGVVAVNPWVRTDAGEASARLRHYYVGRVMSAAFWRKLIAGEADIAGSLRALAGSVRKSLGGGSAAAADYLQRMHASWARRRAPLLIVLSGNDLTAREFEAWIAADESRRRLAREPGCEIRAIEDADHTFASGEWRRLIEAATIEWIGRAV